MVQFNGIQVCTRDVCRYDKYAPWYQEPWYNRDNPGYEEPLLEAVSECVTEGDAVVIIGGGWGVSSVVAAQEAGNSGHVTVYEGARERIGDIEGTLELNDVRDRVTVKHAIVSEPAHLTGAPKGASRVDPDELPVCDVIEMDCEGSETKIIPGLQNPPSILIVETHRNESVVQAQLNDAGYTVVNRGIEKEGEIYVLTAKRHRIP